MPPGVHPDTLNGWLRRAAQEDTETTLEADDYTLRALRALAKTAHVPGYGRLRKADLATAIAAKTLRVFRVFRRPKKGGG